MARHLSSINLSGKRAIEIGCGVGLPSAVALEKGAEVVATDHYPGALDFAAYNAKANAGKSIETALLDWRNPNLGGFGTFDIALAADVLYERVNARYLADLVPRLLSPDGELLLADPRRPGAKTFVDDMEKRGFECSSAEETVTQGAAEIKVAIHVLRQN